MYRLDVIQGLFCSSDFPLRIFDHDCRRISPSARAAPFACLRRSKGSKAQGQRKEAQLHVRYSYGFVPWFYELMSARQLYRCR